MGGGSGGRDVQTPGEWMCAVPPVPGTHVAPTAGVVTLVHLVR